MSKKMEEVKEGNIRVVSEDFLQDVAASTKSLQELVSAHVLSPWGAEVKAEPVAIVAPSGKSLSGKSGAAVSKKSKGPVKEEGEALSCRPWGPVLPRMGHGLSHVWVGRGMQMPCWHMMQVKMTHLLCLPASPLKFIFNVMFEFLYPLPRNQQV